MAGTVAKLPVYNFGQDERRTVMNGNAASEGKMDEDEIFVQLQDESYAKHREYILDELTARVRRNGGKIPFRNTPSLFRGLAATLRDTDKDVRLKCIQFIMDLVPVLRHQLDPCMLLVLSDLISNFSESKVSVRKAAVQTLHMYMKHTSNIEPIFKTIVKDGLESENPKIRTETAISIPVLLTGEFAKTDLSVVTSALAKKFTEDTELMATAGVSLDRICSLVGEETFESYIDSLPTKVRIGYCQRTGRADTRSSQDARQARHSISGAIGIDWNSNKTTSEKPAADKRRGGSTDLDLQFGIVPQDVLDQLSDQEHWTERASGVQELKAIIADLQDTSMLLPHMINFIGFLCNLLDDSNFKVSLHTLEIFQELVKKLHQNIKPFLRHTIIALSKRFGDNKTVIRQANMKVMMQLMHSVGPKSVVQVISELKNQRKAGVREEALNVVIAALLTFPSYDFDLPMICKTLSQCLTDQKRRVRQAALELFAVLAQAMGPTRIGPLIDAVDQIELKTSEDGVMKAVQARLARRQLPHLNEDGLVDYASQTPSSAASSGRTASSTGHDTEWILKARNTSAKERAHSDLSHPSPTRSKLPPTSAMNSESQPPKRFFSAGRGRSKLPWEEDRDDRVTDDRDERRDGRVQVSSAPTQKYDDGLRRPPIKARNTWNSGEEVWDSVPTRRSHGSQDIGNEQGSYRQMHLDKLKMASLNNNTYPGRGRQWEDEGKPNGTHSAPVTERGGPDPFLGNTAVIPKKRAGGGVGGGMMKQSFSQPHHLDEVEASPALRNQQHSYSEKHIPSVGAMAPRSREELEREQRLHRKSLSNSWPDPGISLDNGPSSNPTSGRKKLDLQLDSVHDYHTGAQYDIPSPGKGPLSSGTSPVSPIPLKATLARSAGRRGGQARPLVPLDKPSPRDEYDDWDSYPADTFRSDVTAEEIPNMTSLQTIRGSAAKKRAQKMARDQERSSGHQRSGSMSPYSPHGDLDESGIFSQQSTGRLDYDEGAEKNGVTYVKRRNSKKGSDSPFSSKPRIARANSSKGSRRDSSPPELDGGSNLEFKPAGGVTFRDNATSDVSIVGYGLGNGQGTSRKDVDLSENHVGGKSQNPRDRKRTKGSVLSPLSMASLQHPGGVDLDDSGALVGEDFAMVIGKGVFGSDTNIVEYPRTNGSEKMQRRRSSDNPSDESLPEVVGLNFKKDFDEDSLEEEADLNVSLSKATMDRMARRQQEKKKELEQRKAKHKAEEAEREAEREQQEEQIRILEEELEAQRRERVREQKRLERERQQKEAEKQREERDRQREERMREREEQKRELEERLRLDRERQRAERAERAEREKERESKRQEQQAKARERQREKLKQLESTSPYEQDDEDFIADLAINGATLDNTTRKVSPNTTRIASKPPAASTPSKKKIISVTKAPMNSVSGNSVSSPPQTDGQSREMKPVANSDVAIRDCLRYLGQEDWEVKLHGLFIIQRLASFHANEIGGQLHSIVVAVLNEIKNLRSSVARAAISTLGDLFQGLKTSLDKDLDQICRILLPKAGESTAFIREAVDETLEAMAKNATPQRVLCSLITAGASHKNSMVRRTTVVFLDVLVDRMGPGRILSGVKDVTDKILPTVAQLAMDNGQETRYYARKIFFSLMHHPDFDRLIDKHIPAKNLKSIKDILENLKNKGLGDAPSDTSSAKARRSNPNSRANSGSQSYSRERIDYTETDRTPPGSTKRGKRSGGLTRTETSEDVKALCEGLGASDWNSRLQAIDRLQEMCETNEDVICANVVKVFDKFASRLSDSNSKVNIAALTAMQGIVPRLGESLATVVNNIVPILVQNIANKNPSISQTSDHILDLILEHVDMLVLVQPFSNATQYGNVRARPAMVQKLSYLVTKVYPRKQQTIVRHVLPVLWYLLGNMTGSGAVPGGSGNLRSATAVLANSLYEQMGEVLMQHAQNLPPRNVKSLKELIQEEES